MRLVPDPRVLGQNGAINNFLPHLTEAARRSGGFVLELGVGQGDGSAWAFQQGLAGQPDPLHITVDWQDYMVMKPEVSWWYFVLGDSRQMSTLRDVCVIAAGRKAGLIFIDTDHTYDQMQAELPLWAALADDATTWLFHDTYMHGVRNHMIDAITEFAAANGWRYEDVSTEPHGLARMIR